MKYKGKSVEIIGRQRLFDKETLWIHILDSDTFTQVLAEELEDDGVTKNGLAYARFVAIATKIKQEIAEKHILAPYESNLIPLPTTNATSPLPKAKSTVRYRSLTSISTCSK